MYVTQCEIQTRCCGVPCTLLQPAEASETLCVCVCVPSGEQPGPVCGGGPQAACEALHQSLLQHLPEQCAGGQDPPPRGPEPRLHRRVHL